MTDDIAQCGRTTLHTTHLTTDGRCPGLHRQTPASPDPWRERPTYEQLEAGLRVIASDADVRGDHHVAAFAHLALAGEPFPVDTDDDAEDRAPIVYAGDRTRVEFSVRHLPDTGVLLLPGHGPDPQDLTASAVIASEPAEPTAGWRGGACRLRDPHNDLWVLHADGFWRADGLSAAYGSLAALAAARGDLHAVVS